MHRMEDDSRSPEPSLSRVQRFKSWAGSLALIIGLVIAALVIAELAPVQDLCARIDAALEMDPWLIAIPIALMVAGAILMLGAQLLPAPRGETSPSDQALDAAAAPMEFSEERGRRSRSMSMEATTGQVREAWRRRSWRYSRRWRIFFLMLLGAVLVGAGICGLFVLIGPPFAKVLIAGLALYVAVRILWEFSAR
jgi:hypothetical protein